MPAPGRKAARDPLAPPRALTGSLRGNHRLVVSLLGGRLHLTRAELAAASGLPLSTISGVTKELVGVGLVRDRAGARHPGPGRPGRILTLAGPPGVIAVITESLRQVSVALADFDGSLRSAGVLTRSQFGSSPTTVMERWAGLIETQLQQLGEPSTALLRVVVALPFPYERDEHGIRPGARGHSARAAEELLQHEGAMVEAVTLLERRLRCQVLSENDANLAALGESVFGAGHRSGLMIYVKMVPAIGAGLITGGRIAPGARGLAGEVAHIPVQPDGPPCLCGNRGCMVAVLRPFPALDAERLTLERPLEGRSQQISDTCQQAARGDPVAQRRLVEIGQLLGRALAPLCTFIDPAVIVLDGAVTAQVRTTVVATLREQAPLFHEPEGRVMQGVLGPDAEVYGGVALVRSTFVELVSADLGP